MICMATVPLPKKRGEIWQVHFNPSIGAEIRKLRPAVVVSLDGIGRLPLRIVVPITDWKPEFAQFSWFVFLPATAGNGLAKDSGADAFQVKSVSETRFVRKLGVITDDQLDTIALAIALCVGAP
jgi:mRNA interferase MazF